MAANNQVIAAKEGIKKGPQWEAPVPLTPEQTSQAPYPIDALPSIIRNAVNSYQQYGQQPLSLIACSALANVSLACQNLANVARDSLLVSPISLFFIVIANSGERKSQADYTFSKAIRQWQLDARRKLEPTIRVAQTMHHAWRTTKEGVLSQIRRGSTEISLEDLHEMLIDLEEQEPKIPLLPVLFFEDATQEALASHMANGWPSASLWSDEGGIVVGSHGMQNNATKFIALLNRLWDGKPFIAHRKTSQSFTVANRRLTVSLMMQPLILEQMLTKNGGITRQSGFLARSLIARPQSTMGNRFYQAPNDTLLDIDQFHGRLLERLNESLILDKNGCHDLPTLTLSRSAKTTWIKFFNDVEKGLLHSTQWESIKDFASKSPENVVRLAALFHLFEGENGDITKSHIEQAIEIIRWHLLETRDILGETPKNTQHSDAIKLLRWITEKGLQNTSVRNLQQYSPLREKNRLNKSIEILTEFHYLKEYVQDGRSLFLVNPVLFS